MKKTVEYLISKKKNNQKISALTAYDYPTALLLEEAGIDVIILGDSVGTNVLGYENETCVTLADMMHHTNAVKRAVKSIFLIVDLPYKTHETPEDAVKNAKKLVACGADAVKFEGIKSDIVQALVKENITVVSHVGLNPQYDQELMKKGKITRGKSFDEAVRIIEGAVMLEKAGAALIVLEKIPGKIAQIITASLTIPTIGIGAGNCCDGQVLIINDILGLSSRKYKHVKEYADMKPLLLNAVSNYKNDVERMTFPASEHTNRISDTVFDKIKDWYAQWGKGLG